MQHPVDLAELARQTVFILKIDFDTAENGPREVGPFSTRAATIFHLLLHFKTQFGRGRKFQKRDLVDLVEPCKIKFLICRSASIQRRTDQSLLNFSQIQSWSIYLNQILFQFYLNSIQIWIWDLLQSD